jgi:hypothetical protein
MTCYTAPRTPVFRSLPLLLGLCLAVTAPALAQDQDQQADPPTAQQRFEELIDRLMGRLEPGFESLGEMLGDLSGWHAPEILPNGDILIRRRDQPSEPPPTEDDPPVTDPLEL